MTDEEKAILQKFISSWDGYEYSYIDIGGADVEEFMEVVAVLKRYFSEEDNAIYNAGASCHQTES